MPVGIINAGTDVKPSFDNKLYIGGGNFKIIAINPTKAEKEKIYPNRTFEEEPVYTGERDGVKSIRIEFTLQSMDVENLLIPVSFFVRNELSVGKNSGKYEVIDKYARTVWLTKDELDRHYVPTFQDGTPKIDADYRVAYSGESQLTNWMKNVLNIRNVMEFNTNHYIAKPSDAEIYFETIKDWTNGNINELVDMWKMAPDAVFTAMVGVRTTERGSFHTIYTGNILHAGNAAGPFNGSSASSVKKINRIMDCINADKASGRLQDCEFSNKFIHEFKIEPTDLSKQIFSAPVDEENDLPF